MCQQRISYLEVDLIAKKRLKYGLLSQVFINSLSIIIQFKWSCLLQRFNHLVQSDSRYPS